MRATELADNAPKFVWRWLFDGQGRPRVAVTRNQARSAIYWYPESGDTEAAWQQPPSRYERGYGWMFGRHILQAHEGCDFDFLETSFDAPVPEPSIF